MATYPYISAQGGIVAAVKQLRSSFPGTVDAGYFQRFNIAPSNESYVLATLKFLGLIDEEGKQVGANTGYFFGDEEAFRAGLEGSVRDAYAQLFAEMGDGALTAEKGTLTHWFRASDKTSGVIGQRQATTFLTLASLAGHGDAPQATAKKASAKKASAKKVANKSPVTPATEKPAKKSTKETVTENPGEGGTGGGGGTEVGLSVRIEVNLPPGGDAETYDAIFASIKKHLMS